MLKNKSKQRGFAQVASAVVLAAFAALLGTIGCSSDPVPEEHAGSIRQRLTCGLITQVTCPLDTICGKWACSKDQASCVVTPLLKDGEVCGTKVTPGMCIDGQCCPGCLILP